MSKDEGGWNSSFSEKPVRSRLRRLVDWINLMGAKKVHSLIDKVYKRKNLEMAWEKVKENRGSGGIDGQSLTAFEAQLGPQLARLQRELEENTYQPLPVQQHPIPKRDKPGEYRMLGIPAIYDRVCQQALLNRLEPIFEPVFDDASFGYRQRMHCARSGKRSKAGRSGSWMRTSEIFSGPSITKNFSRWCPKE
jgi:RNA-directed DNA polymerase